MNYKLAKQLKEAGFPFKSPKVWCVNKDHPEHLEDLAYTEIELPNTDAIILPTLSELIEACGGNYSDFELIKTAGYWKAKITLCHRMYYVDYLSDGDTPEEAVAELFIEIRK